MDNLEYIDNYFHSEKNPDQTRLFEQKIRDDAAFAADLAFYLSARQAAAENPVADSLNRFRELYEADKRSKPGKARIIPLYMRWVAVAALVAAVIFGVFTSQERESPQELADHYIATDMQTLGLKMGKEDELQKGSNLYNQKKYIEARAIFESLIQSDSTNFQALENAGKASIQLGQYDIAMAYFRSLEILKVYASPEKFYEALTLMKRNQIGDKDKAKEILQEIVARDLDMKSTAEKWLKKW
jgi:tetratricopeptide (TPR) repeat protein